MNDYSRVDEIRTNLATNGYAVVEMSNLEVFIKHANYLAESLKPQKYK